MLFSHSVVYNFANPWTTAHQASLSFTISQSLLKLMSIELMMPSNHLILCRPFLFLPSIFPSIRGFSNKLALHIRWPKYWSFSFSIRPSNEYSGMISFRIDWFDLLAVQGTLRSLLQNHVKWGLDCGTVDGKFFVCLFWLVGWFLATPCGLWDLSSQARDWTWSLGNDRSSLKHWITREFPSWWVLFLITII